MSIFLSSKFKVIRRLGLLPGLTLKKINQKGKLKKFESNSKNTEYMIQLKEKQKLKFNYILNENQLIKYIKQSKKKKGITSLILLQLLEMRLDSICFNLGFAHSIMQARQIISHNHILINNHKINISSFQCKPNDVIGVKKNSKSKYLINNNLKTNFKRNIPFHIKFNSNLYQAIILDYCTKKDIQLNLNELSVIEYYSKK
uniref:Ribosomal protein S4 n=1 Tax=Nitzschia sp. IriIs04 TaxID=1444690 RepID=A0A0S3QPP7_9STRA|nr:ribosomal protein S4 [Nitzschia sp. IriIs04]BAT70313.1 ribosomal protein S4 [Nitzschia sp. IriIs04]